MNRRSFLAGLGALIGGIAVEQAIPFNRVWSFPKEIVVPNFSGLANIYYGKESLAALGRNLVLNVSTSSAGMPFLVSGEYSVLRGQPCRVVY